MSIWNKYLPTIINILSLSIYELCTFHVPMLCYYYVNLWDDCLTEINNLNLIWYYLYIHPTIWHLHCTVIHPCASSMWRIDHYQPFLQYIHPQHIIYIGFRYMYREREARGIQRSHEQQPTVLLHNISCAFQN